MVARLVPDLDAEQDQLRRFTSIEDLQSEIQRAQEHLSSLLSGRNTCLSPISRLPDDVFRQIFKFHTWYKNEHKFVVEDPRLLHTILLVCRRWHVIAVGSPCLWIELNHVWSQSDGFPVFMRRAGGLPLSLTWHPLTSTDGDAENERTREIDIPIEPLRLALENFSRMREVFLICGLSASKKIHETLEVALTAPNVPHLQNLTVELSSAVNNRVAPDLHHLPKLTYLKLWGFEWSNFHSWRMPRLTNLNLKFWGRTPSLTDFLDFFANSPSLHIVYLEALAAEKDFSRYIKLVRSIEDASNKRIVHLPDVGNFTCKTDLPTSPIACLASHLHFSHDCDVSLTLKHFWVPSIDSDAIFSNLLPLSADKLTPAEIDIEGTTEELNVRFDCFSNSEDAPFGSFSVQLPLKAYNHQFSWETYLEHKNNPFVRLHRHTCSFASLTVLNCTTNLQANSWTDVLSTCTHLSTIELSSEALQEVVTALTSSITPTTGPLLPALSSLTIHDTYHWIPDFFWRCDIPPLSEVLTERKRKGLVLEELCIKRESLDTEDFGTNEHEEEQAVKALRAVVDQVKVVHIKSKSRASENRRASDCSEPEDESDGE